MAKKKKGILRNRYDRMNEAMPEEFRSNKKKKMGSQRMKMLGKKRKMKQKKGM